MTSAEFSARYQLLKPVADGKVRTLNALAVANGKVVMVHYLVGTADENNALLARVRALPDIERLRLIEILDVEGHQVVVTQFLQGFESLDVWLSSHTPGGAAAGGGGGAKQIKGTMRRPDEQTQRPGSTQPIRAGSGGAGKVTPPAPPPSPPVAPPPTAASATMAMTQPMAPINAPPAAAPPAPPPAPPVVPPAPPRPASAVPQGPPPPAPAPNEPGEFTRLFN